MSEAPICPMCSTNEILEHPDRWECVTCGHEWERAAAPPAARVVKDAHGTVLADGDSITLIKDLKLKGSSQSLKGGTKAKGIRLVDGDHDVDCKIDGVSLMLKSEFLKKA